MKRNVASRSVERDRRAGAGWAWWATWRRTKASSQLGDRWALSRPTLCAWHHVDINVSWFSTGWNRRANVNNCSVTDTLAAGRWLQIDLPERVARLTLGDASK